MNRLLNSYLLWALESEKLEWKRDKSEQRIKYFQASKQLRTKTKTNQPIHHLHYLLENGLKNGNYMRLDNTGSTIHTYTYFTYTYTYIHIHVIS